MSAAFRWALRCTLRTFRHSFRVFPQPVQPLRERVTEIGHLLRGLCEDATGRSRRETSGRGFGGREGNAGLAFAHNGWKILHTMRRERRPGAERKPCVLTG